METIECTIEGNYVKFVSTKDETTIMGNVCMRDGEPVLTVIPLRGIVTVLTLNEIEIIMDNWNALKEIQSQNK